MYYPDLPEAAQVALFLSLPCMISEVQRSARSLNAWKHTGYYIPSDIASQMRQDITGLVTIMTNDGGSSYWQHSASDSNTPCLICGRLHSVIWGCAYETPAALWQTSTLSSCVPDVYIAPRPASLRNPSSEGQCSYVQIVS